LKAFRITDESRLADDRVAVLRASEFGMSANSPSGNAVELHVAELRQLFEALDPGPFGERDLEARAHEFIVERSRDLPRQAPLGLLVQLDRPAGFPDEQAALRNAVHGHFRKRAGATRRRLRRFFHIGRIRLSIGLGFLAIAVAANQALERSPYDVAVVLSEIILIGGWVALWRPLEIFMYDWWTIRADARLFDRLAAMPVCIRYGSRGPSDAWRRDWPAAAPVSTRDTER
jgi:hypothetical protein